MKLNYFTYNGVWDSSFDDSFDSTQTLVIVFSTYPAEALQEPLDDISTHFKNSIIIGASTSGNILLNELRENSLVVTVIKFASTTLQLVSNKIHSMQDSFKVGQELASQLHNKDLKDVFVLSNGLQTNGSKLTDGLNSILNKSITTSGALAGDDAKFESTYIIINNQTYEDYICAVGFYGENIHFETASKNGLDKFGVQRIVTNSKNNILYELDKQPALEIYKKYLGDKAKDLPSSGLYFPLAIKYPSHKEIIRTILSVNHQENSITFAGDIPQGSTVSFMKANYDRLIDGANEAANELDFDKYKGEPLLCIAVSCIARKLVLKQRTEEELEAVFDVLPPNTLQVGMYSFGEISPTKTQCCQLHNQTMTLTAIWEKDA